MAKRVGKEAEGLKVSAYGDSVKWHADRMAHRRVFGIICTASATVAVLNPDDVIV